MRINNAGHYEYCRWADKSDRNSGPNIRDIDPAEFFQQTMQPIRAQLVDGNKLPGCQECYLQDQHGKISGRQKQLLKTGVRLAEFEKTMVSSPWVNEWANPDKFSQLPQDWQIDLGNFCNSACIFCDPASSSRLAHEWKAIGFVDSLPLPNWCDDPTLVQKFVDTLKSSSHIRYLHFIGGETVITPAFETILRTLIAAGINKTATIGFTTNLISWNDTVIDLLTQFAGVNLGLSVVCFDTVNDYVRYPAKLDIVKTTFHRWLNLAKKQNWLLQFRTTPTALTIHKLTTVYDLAWEHNITVESCNFLNNPEVLRPSVLPQNIRANIIDSMQEWLNQHPAVGDDVINIRNPNTARLQMVQDLLSYINYLKNQPDESNLLPELVDWLKKIEARRKNSILDYIPEYEELFRTAGY
jgi:sulfatase maturation enzyme AslB (radical SAM superfamily)